VVVFAPENFNLEPVGLKIITLTFIKVKFIVLLKYTEIGGFILSN